MSLKRREFLKVMGIAAAGATVPFAFRFLAKGEAAQIIKTNKLRYVFLVDTKKCVGCGMCVRACKLENGIPYNAQVSRTWVERYVEKKDGQVLADSPMAGRDGFTSDKVEGQKVDPADIAKGFFVPKLCNQCDKPPCVQVCPVGASFQMENGIVLVNRKWCIGCGYCIMSCPYGARFFQPEKHVADKCTWCYHRLVKGLKPACVQACPFGARRIGNGMDPSDPVTRIITSERVGVLKEQFGTKPQVYYIGLDKNVR